MAFAGLDESQNLEALILGAKAAWKERDGIRLFHEQELARKEVLEVHELDVAGNDGIGFLLERQQDIDADAVIPAGADVAGLHDAAGRSGDDHEAGLDNTLAKVDGLLIGWIFR